MWKLSAADTAEYNQRIKYMSNNVKYWRNERLLNQVELAIASNLPRWKCQLIEQGLCVPTKEELEALASVLGVDINSLVKQSDQEDKKNV